MPPGPSELLNTSGLRCHGCDLSVEQLPASFAASWFPRTRAPTQPGRCGHTPIQIPIATPNRTPMRETPRSPVVQEGPPSPSTTPPVLRRLPTPLNSMAALGTPGNRTMLNEHAPWCSKARAFSETNYLSLKEQSRNAFDFYIVAAAIQDTFTSTTVTIAIQPPHIAGRKTKTVETKKPAEPAR